MRPLLLKMQAFGPYAGPATVDFRRVLQSGLFGIYGATGSGKSSIFNAITFALFGEAARGEQHARTLRSDHADPDLPTQVELIFEIGARRYRVVRRPDQMRPVKRGSGETEDKHKAWLFDVTGLDPDHLGEELPGRPIAENKVGDVNAAIVGLLGYEAAQFRQIVLLPQGRFETFLNAKTEERLGILRELFDVSVYERLTEALRARARGVRDEIVRRREVNARRLASERFDSLDQLDDGIAAAGRQCADLAAARADAEAALEQADAAYREAAQTDKQFAEYADAETGLKAIEANAAAIATDSAKLRAARAAAAIVPRADALLEAERAVQKAIRTRDGAAQQRRRAEEAATAAADRAQALDAQAASIEARREQLRRLREFTTVLASVERLRDVHLAAARTAADMQRALVEAENALRACIDRHQQAVAEREAARAAQVTRSGLRLQAQQLGERLKAAEAFEKAQGALARSREQHARALAERESALRVHEARRREFAALEAALLDSHALHLAAHLEPGKPCPVCGSPEHPAPAAGTAADADLAARYRQAKAALEASRTAAEVAANAAVEAGSRLRQREEALAEFVVPDTTAREIAGSMAAVQRDIEALGQERDLDSCDMRVAEEEAALSAAQIARDAARDDREVARMEAARAKTELESALARVPEHVRAAGALAAAIEATEHEIAAYDRAYEEAVEARQGAAGILASATTALQLAESGLKTAEHSRHEADERFDTGLSGCGLTRDAFEAARGDIGAIDEIERRVQSFSQKLAAAKDRLDRAKLAIAATDRPDISALKVAREAAEAERERALETSLDAVARLSQLQKLHREVREEAAALDRLEAETGPLRDLALAFAGENDARTTLETFAIATMFDRVLAAANLRLEPMTRGRFRLSRCGEGHGRARRGLDIQVEDSFTGRPRPTSTLSGGETFIAALALALGLSDVVEGTRGNVRLDAIFIDEGFGSLDSADDAGTLDQVLQSLTQLVGKRRAVGLISHVPLVQQTVPNGFWIRSSPGGSRIEERN